MALDPALRDLPLTTIDGRSTSLAEFGDDATILVVNVASKCGNTPQYAQLEELQRRYADQGFTVVGFPCNQFLGQEPGSNEDIQEFCSRTYGVTFPLMDKTRVNGPHRHPLYAWLTKQKRGFLGSQAIKWNFTKFLTDREGRVVARYAPQTEPEAIKADIEKLI